MPSVEVEIEKLVQAVTCTIRCLAVVFQPMTEQGPAGLEVRVIESGPSLPQLAILLEQSAAGVQASRAPVKMSVVFPDAPLPACREDRMQPPPGTARCLQG